METWSGNIEVQGAGGNLQIMHLASGRVVYLLYHIDEHANHARKAVPRFLIQEKLFPVEKALQSNEEKLRTA